MRRVFKIPIVLAVIVTGLQLSSMTMATAASTSPPTSGITVSPAFITAQIGSAQSQATASVGVRNNYAVPITVTAVLNGFDIRNNSLLLTNQSEFSLAEIVKFSPAEITIPPQSSRNIAVIITDKPSLSPGGHYVSLLITQSSSNGPNSSPQLSLKPAVSATVYVIKEDGAVRSLRASNIELKRSIFTLPNMADITFTNNGNVTNLPRGILTINRGSGGAVYAQAIVNQESVPLYPNQSTKLRSSFTALAKPKLPSKLVATLDYRPDGIAETKSLSVDIWYVPISSFIVVLLSIAVSGLIFWPKSRRNITRIARKMKKSNKKPYIPPDLNKPSKLVSNGNNQAPRKKRHFDIK